MKKFLSLITTLAVLSSLTACTGGNQSSEQSSSQTSDQSTSQTIDESLSRSTDQSTESLEQSGESFEPSEDAVKAALDAFPMDDFPAPDGTVLKKADATLFSNLPIAVGYEFSYIRKVQPVFRNTIDEPDSFDWNEMQFTPELPEASEDLGYFKIKAGDVLDNGLTVKSAEIYLGMGIDGQTYYTAAEFDGELTLDGILYCFPEDGYNIGKGDVYFFPDCAKHTDFIAPYEEFLIEPNLFCDMDDSLAIAYSGNNLYLGNESEMPSDVSELFRHKTSLKARITITDLGYYQTMAGVKSFAKIVSAAEP